MKKIDLYIKKFDLDVNETSEFMVEVVKLCRDIENKYDLNSITNEILKNEYSQKGIDSVSNFAAIIKYKSILKKYLKDEDNYKENIIDLIEEIVEELNSYNDIFNKLYEFAYSLILSWINYRYDCYESGFLTHDFEKKKYFSFRIFCPNKIKSFPDNLFENISICQNRNIQLKTKKNCELNFLSLVRGIFENEKDLPECEIKKSFDHTFYIIHDICAIEMNNKQNKTLGFFYVKANNINDKQTQKRIFSMCVRNSSTMSEIIDLNSKINNYPDVDISNVKLIVKLLN